MAGLHSHRGHSSRGGPALGGCVIHEELAGCGEKVPRLAALVLVAAETGRPRR